METTEKRFESDIEAAFLSPSGGYAKGTPVSPAENGVAVELVAGYIAD